MENKQSYSFFSFLPAFFLMLIVGWGGFAWTVLYTLPYVWQRWELFVFMIIGLTAIALPVTYFLNIRFPSIPPANPIVVLRQAIWVGVYGSTLAWLQLGDLVSSWTFLGLAVGIIAIEALIRLVERTRWQPPTMDEIDFFHPEG